jgi:hypothetical protein
MNTLRIEPFNTTDGREFLTMIQELEPGSGLMVQLYIQALDGATGDHAVFRLLAGASRPRGNGTIAEETAREIQNVIRSDGFEVSADFRVTERGLGVVVQGLEERKISWVVDGASQLLQTVV